MKIAWGEADMVFRLKLNHSVLMVVSHSHTTFRKRGKGSGNFFYSSLLYCSVQCVTNQSAVFCRISAAIATSIQGVDKL